MQDNNVLSHYKNHANFTDSAIRRALEEVSALTGFIPEGEIQRRFLYDRDKTWRVRIAGSFNGQPAILRLENMKLETDEELFRQAFRDQANGIIRPPKTYASAPFDPAKEFGWSLDEAVGGRPLFDPAGDPHRAVHAFIPFYDALRLTVRTAFTPEPDMTVLEYSLKQFRSWTDLARERNPEALTRHADILARIEARFQKRYDYSPLRFMHAHLSGSDVRITDAEEFVVFANHFWSWRQSGYDVAFAIWSQWMALPPERRQPFFIRGVTEAWLTSLSPMLSADSDGVDDLERPPGSTMTWLNRDDLRAMLLNRCYGSLILDIPAKCATESRDSVDRLEEAVRAEAERLIW